MIRKCIAQCIGITFGGVKNQPYLCTRLHKNDKAIPVEKNCRLPVNRHFRTKEQRHENYNHTNEDPIKSHVREMASTDADSARHARKYENGKRLYMKHTQQDVSSCITIIPFPRTGTGIFCI